MIFMFTLKKQRLHDARRGFVGCCVCSARHECRSYFPANEARHASYRGACRKNVGIIDLKKSGMVGRSLFTGPLVIGTPENVCTLTAKQNKVSYLVPTPNTPLYLRMIG